MRHFMLLALLAGCASTGGGEAPDVGVGVGDDLAGTSRVDLATFDATDADVRGLVLANACTDSISDVYTTPSLAGTALGQILRCARDTSVDLDLAGTQSALDGESIAVTATSGVQGYRVSFRTTRGDGSPGASTARVYLPTTPGAGPLPVLVAGHPTEGVADACAPSMNTSELLDVELPWAALGYAIIAPDYSGLGNETIDGYLDNHDQGYAILDGARALRALFEPGGFEPRVVISGWSQGGGAALSAQALASTYGAGGPLAAVVAFAPEWPIRDNSFGLATLALDPDADIAFNPGASMLSYSNHVIWTQRAYGFFGQFSKLTTNPGAAFPASTSAAMVASMNTLCGEVQLGGAIYAEALASDPPLPKNGDLFDPAFRTAFVACLTSTTSAGCTGLAQEFVNHMHADVLKGNGQGAPVLYLQGLADTVLPPNTEAACIVQKLAVDGLVPSVCVDTAAQHTNVTNRNTPYAISWVQAILDGKAAPPCPQSGSLPTPSCN